MSFTCLLLQRYFVIESDPVFSVEGEWDLLFVVPNQCRVVPIQQLADLGNHEASNRSKYVVSLRLVG